MSPEPDKLNTLIHPFQKVQPIKRLALNTVIVERAIEIPLPTGIIVPIVQYTIDTNSTDGTVIMPRDLRRGYHVTNADLNENLRRSKFRSVGRRHRTRLSQNLAITMDFDGIEVSEIEDTGFDSLGCVLVAGGVYRGVLGMDWRLYQEDTGKYLEGNAYFDDFFPAEIGPLAGRDEYTIYRPDGSMSVGFGHRLGFSTSPRRAQEIAEIGVIFTTPSS